MLPGPQEGTQEPMGQDTVRLHTRLLSDAPEWRVLGAGTAFSTPSTGALGMVKATPADPDPILNSAWWAGRVSAGSGGCQTSPGEKP